MDFFAVLHSALLAFVNYIDEYLTTNNKVKDKSSIHKQIGGLLLISTLMSFLGAFVVFLYVPSLSINISSLLLTVASGFPMVFLFASYFYLLTLYPTHQVIPLFQMSSIWLLLIEILSGAMVTLMSLTGIFVLIIGAFVLDTGSFKWQIPTKLLLLMTPATLFWSIAMFFVRVASYDTAPLTISFYQLLTVGVVGVLLFLLIKPFREGFLYRIKHQGGNFLGFSLVNESLSQGAYTASNFAIALAPLAAYVAALGGLQSIFLIILFFLFPIHKRVQITKMQIVAIAIISLGVLLIEL